MRLGSALALAMATPTLPAQTRPKKPADYVADARKWAHEESDLAPDPRMNFGALANGLRWVWVQNTNPPKQLLLRLHVNVGSLHENRDELGLAHFLEHLAFNGSKNFKAGTLVPFFQGQGIRFGSDVNAHTSFDETVYELDLPDAEPGRLEKALLWLRDVVDGLKLDPAEIAAEKGVVDAEQDVRDGRGSDLWVERIRHLLDGSRYPRRIVIGERAVRAKFDRKICAAFYERWYRPENVTFVMVGDLGGQDPRALIEKAFTGARGRGEAEEAPGTDLEHLTGRDTLFSQFTGGSRVELYAGRMRARDAAADDSSTRAKALALALACDVLESRLDELVPRPYVVASVGSGRSFHPSSELLRMPLLDGVSLHLVTTVEQWPLALQAAERETRRLLERGIGDDELQAARSRLDQRLVARPLHPPPSNHEFVAEILRACRGSHVPMEDRAAKEAARAAARAADAEACMRAFRTAWNDGRLFLCAQGALDLKDAARETFEQVWTEAQGSSLDSKLVVREDLSVRAPRRARPAVPAGDPADGGPAAPAEAKGDAGRFAYARPDADAPEHERETLADLRLTKVRFENGVRALLKFVPGAEGEFRVEVRVGEGLLALDPQRADVAKVAELAFLDGGTARHGRGEIDAALAAAGARLEFRVAGDACVFSGRSTGSGGEAGLRRSLEAVCAWLTDAAFTPARFEEFRRRLDERVPDHDRPTWQNAGVNFDRLLANGDPRLLPLERAAAAKIALDEVKGYLQGQLDGPVEVVVAGGVFPDKQLRHVASTLGQLPARRAPAAFPDERRRAAPAKLGLFAPSGAIDLGGRVTHLRIVYPCPDAIDADSERRLDLLGDIVGDRLRADIREKLGTTYSPHGEAWGDSCFRGRGFVQLDVQVDPALLQATKEACLASMESLAKSGAKKAEFERLRAARSGNPEALARDLGFWMHQLRRAMRAPALLDELRDLRRWYDRVTVEQVNALAKQTLSRDRASILEVTPR